MRTRHASSENMFRSIIVRSEIYALCKTAAAFSRKSVDPTSRSSREESAKSLRLCVKIRETRREVCPSGIYYPSSSRFLVSRSLSSLRPWFPLRALFTPALPHGESLFRVLFTHNRAFTCKLDITT
jgi:hypothetical protein